MPNYIYTGRHPHYQTGNSGLHIHTKSFSNKTWWDMMQRIDVGSFNRLDHYRIRCDCMFDKRWEFTEETNSLQPDTCEPLWFPAWNQFAFSLNFHCSSLWFDLHYSSFAFTQTRGNHTSTLPVRDTFVISAKSIKVTHSLCRSEVYQCFFFLNGPSEFKKKEKKK